MAGQDRRHNAHKMSKKKQARAQAGLMERFKKALGLDTLIEDEPIKVREIHNRSKYSPHQGEAERARRRKQIANGTLKYENGYRSHMCCVANKVFDTVMAADKHRLSL
jgi:hypothetical protein